MTLTTRSLAAFTLSLAVTAGCTPMGPDDTGATTEDTDDTTAGETNGESTTSSSGATDPTADATGSSGNSSGATDSTGGDSSTSIASETDPTVSTSATSSTSDSQGETDPTDPTTGGVMGCEDALEPITDLKNALAVRWGDIPEEMTTGNSSSTTGGDGLDPDTILVTLANNTYNTCQDPFGIGDCNGALLWKVDFVLPPEYQQPGLYTLDELNGGQFATGPNGDIPDDCWFGGGSLSGWVLIESIDDDKVVGRLCGTEVFEDYDPDGSFEAPRCN
ncbi:MAG: hypothetical protein H6713_30770 [Myxococcales bacterium]|nr:hypothetical protein [Myxococcales bacterium]